jgi:hypothetical protein
VKPLHTATTRWNSNACTWIRETNLDWQETTRQVFLVNCCSSYPATIVKKSPCKKVRVENGNFGCLLCRFGSEGLPLGPGRGPIIMRS